MGVRFTDFPRQYAEERDEILSVVDAVFRAGMFVGGAEIALFEAEVADYLGGGHAVAVSSGTSALALALRAAGIGPGDEVVTQPNSFISTTLAILAVGAKPVFADVSADQNIDVDAVAAAIGPRTAAVLPAHLTGRMAEIDRLAELCRRHGLLLIEDAAQAIGSSYRGVAAGRWGAFGCFSLHPLKNLNAAGDAGFVLTADGTAAAKLRRLRNLGLRDRDTAVELGEVARLDTLQAAILRSRLKHLPDVIARRQANAARYRARLNPRYVYAPHPRPEAVDTYHTFVIQVEGRDALRQYLTARGIETAIHYPRPIHLQPAMAFLGQRPGAFPVTERQAATILSLPVHQFLTEAEITEVTDAIDAFVVGGG